MKFFCILPPLELHPSPEPPAIYGNVEWITEFGSADVKDLDYETITCSLAPGHRRAGARIGDLDLLLSTSRIGDFVWTYMSECVITDRVLSLFAGARLTGFNPRRASVAGIRHRRESGTEPSQKVWEIEVTGKAGDAHPASGIRVLYVCPQCAYTVYSSFRKGIVVDETKWDGSDFFTVKGYRRHILITERVKDLIIQNKLSNCAIFRSEDLRWGNIPKPEDHPETYIPAKMTVKS